MALTVQSTYSLFRYPGTEVARAQVDSKSIAWKDDDAKYKPNAYEQIDAPSDAVAKPDPVDPKVASPQIKTRQQISEFSVDATGRPLVYSLFELVEAGEHFLFLIVRTHTDALASAVVEHSGIGGLLECLLVLPRHYTCFVSSRL